MKVEDYHLEKLIKFVNDELPKKEADEIRTVIAKDEILRKIVEGIIIDKEQNKEISLEAFIGKSMKDFKAKLDEQKKRSKDGTLILPFGSTKNQGFFQNYWKIKSASKLKYWLYAALSTLAVFWFVYCLVLEPSYQGDTNILKPNIDQLIQSGHNDCENESVKITPNCGGKGIPHQVKIERVQEIEKIKFSWVVSTSKRKYSILFSILSKDQGQPESGVLPRRTPFNEGPFLDDASAP